jgi:ABC-type Fe3+ transport system permease subunit
LGIASAAVLIGWLLLAALAMIRLSAPHDTMQGIRPPRLYPLGRWRWPIAAAMGVSLLLAVGVPLASLVYQAGVVVTPTDVGVTRAWSPIKCLAIVAESPWRYRREFGWSLLIAGLASVAAVIAATLLAWWARHSRSATMAVALLAAVLLATPGPAIGVAIIRLLNRPEFPLLVWLYDQSILAPWLALLARSLPPAIFVLWYALASVPRDLLDAATVDGAGGFRRLLLVALPLRWPAVAAAWLVAMAIALGDLAASILVVPPGVMLLSRRIFDLIHYGVEDYLAGVCLALIVMFAATAAAIAWLAGRLSRQRAQEQREL